MPGATKTLATLGLLTAVAPLNAALTAAALLRGRRVVPATAARPRTVLLSGGKMTKALALARAFHRAGHRVVLVESRRYRFTGHRTSRAVSAFHVVPEPDAPGYAEALLAVVRAEEVDVYVPVSSPVASRFDAEARALLAPHCDVVHPDADVVAALDDKHAFSRLARSFGLGVPDAHRITDPQQVRDFDFAANPGPYVLKSIPYDPIRRLDLTRLPRPTPQETDAYLATLPISDRTPFVLQAFVTGTEWCTHGTVRDGRVLVSCCCPSSASLLNYQQVQDPEIEAWVARFAAGLGATGQLSFDFIRGDDGTLRAIECNPRTHSAITLLQDHPGLAAAYLDDGAPAVSPDPAGRPTYWLYNELWGALRHPGRLRATMRTLVRGRDAIFDWTDPLPFLAVHHVQVPSLLLGNLVRGRPWRKIDFNIGKLVEPGGD